jgi:Ca-activated chloride channel homolog
MNRAGLLLIVALAAAVAAGPQAWAKLFWRAGAPALALPLIRDEAARGAALYEIGRYPEADAVFEKIGRSATYDRGLTLALNGRYDLSLAYFDAVLFADRYDADAQRNRATVAALVPPVVGEAMGHGRIRAILTEKGVATEAFDPDHPELDLMSDERNAARRSIKRPVTSERTLTADGGWLDTLADAPGAFLKARLAAEMERRKAAGTAWPEEPTRW